MRDKGSFPFNLKCRKFRLVLQMERTISVCRPEYSGPALKVVHFDRSGHFGRSDRHDKIVSLFQAFRQQSAAVSGGARVGLIKNPVEHSSHVGLCMAMQGYVLLCRAMQGYLWLCIALQGYVGLCMAMQGYVGLPSFVFFVRVFFSRALLSERLEQAKLLSPIPFFLSRLQELIIIKRAVAWVPSSTQNFRNFKPEFLNGKREGYQRLFTIYMGKPVGSRFGLMVRKVQDC